MSATSHLLPLGLGGFLCTWRRCGTKHPFSLSSSQSQARGVCTQTDTWKGEMRENKIFKTKSLQRLFCLIVNGSARWALPTLFHTWGKWGLKSVRLWTTWDPVKMQILTQGLGGAWDAAFLTSSQEVPMLLVPSQHFGSKRLQDPCFPSEPCWAGTSFYLAEN